ncbi:MAG: tetratricopeptide (TPR) repeat protein [Candidatus Paceibacteria bacterium]|jgi:tetratricopeptide (TPR) repeat protein
MSKHSPEWSPWFGALVVILCGLVYANSLEGVFVMDDFGTIVGNSNIEALWPLSRSMDAPLGSGSSGRPVVALSFALNYAFGGRDVLGYHVVNVLLHIMTGLVFFGCLRRGLMQLATRGLTTVGPTLAATLIAALWMLHPLHTAALNHVTYRNEVLVAFFYLLSLYAALRGWGACTQQPTGRSFLWFVLSVGAAAIAMGCKETAVSLPLVILFLNVTLFQQRWSEALRRDWRFYLGLACTWLLLGWIVAGGDRGESVGVGVRGITSLDYLRTQAGVLPHYLRLALWPDPLVLDYRDWAIVANWGEVWLAGLGVVAVFGMALSLLLRRHVQGACLVAVFAVLAPTSSFIPITGAVAAEHRMYLPLAGLMVVGAAAVARLLRAAGLRGMPLAHALVITSLLLAVPLGSTTFLRNRDFQSGIAIWQDTIEKRPNNSLAWTNYGGVLFHQGDHAGALDAARRAAELDRGNHKAFGNLGSLLREVGDLEGAAQAYRGGVLARPTSGPLRFELGRAMVDLGQLPEGWAHVDAALDLGLAQAEQLRVALQVATLRATSRDPELRDGARALQLAQILERLGGGRNPRYLGALAAAQAELGQFESALRSAQQAIALAQGPRRVALLKELRLQLAAYQAGRPWRQE